MKKLLISIILLLTASFACAETPWRVTETTLPKLRKISMEDFGKEPDAEDIKKVDSILRNTEFHFIHEEGGLSLKIARTDLEGEVKVFMLKQDTGKILSGVTKGSTHPSIFLAQLDEKRFLVWYRSPKDGFEIERK